jgi:hypothetical protein
MSKRDRLDSKKSDWLYLPLDTPLHPDPFPIGSGISPLHYLYPGVPMNSRWWYNRDEIPPADPFGAQMTYISHKLETLDYAKNLEAMARAEGGGDDKKLDVHPPVEPEVNLEDPEARFVSPVLADFNQVAKFPYGPFGSSTLRQPTSDNQPVGSYSKEQSVLPPTQKMPIKPSSSVMQSVMSLPAQRKSAGVNIKENFTPIPLPKTPPQQRSTTPVGSSGGNNFSWLIFVLFIGLILIALMLIVFRPSKHHTEVYATIHS